MKTIERNGSTRTVPEFEECRRLARELHVPLQEVRQRLLNELNPIP